VSKLAEIREACEKATKGPWEATRPFAHPGVFAVAQVGAGIDWICSMQTSNQPNFVNDAAFIAMARTELPRLAGAMEKIREHIMRYCMMEDAGNCADCEMDCDIGEQLEILREAGIE
jgi:hypothetical protein